MNTELTKEKDMQEILHILYCVSGEKTLPGKIEEEAYELSSQ